MVHVSCSAELAPLIKLLPRAETAVVDAYLAPVIAGYVGEVAAAVQRGRLHVMTSAGGLSRAADFRAKDSLLSGPAGGVVGASTVAARSGFGSIIAFDMGGTSTDVARWQGELEYVFEHSVGGARLMAPALAIESVAAGGGSICHFDGDRLLVGPQSAGADPGPACYGAGGPLAMTDVNLLLGRIDPDRFEIPLAPRCSADRLDGLLDEVQQCSGERLTRETALEGFLQIANERMASAIRRISVRQGHDPRTSVLVAFGGAGPQHAVAVADLLDITTVLVPEDASLLSALGLGHAQVERFVHEQVLEPLERCAATLEGRIRRLLGLARERLRSEMIDDGPGESGAVEERCLVAVRMKGQEAALEIPWRQGIDLEAAFGERYEAVFGYAPPGGSIEVESLRAIARERRPSLVSLVPGAVADDEIGPSSLQEGSLGGDDGSGLKEGWGVELKRRRVHLGGAWQEIPVLERAALASGFSMDGPLLVAEPHSVTVVEAGWRLERDRAGALVLRRSRSGDEVDDAG
jgi:5-oxoprolinase (ATP-hydrolysing)